MSKTVSKNRQFLSILAIFALFSMSITGCGSLSGDNIFLGENQSQSGFGSVLFQLNGTPAQTLIFSAGRYTLDEAEGLNVLLNGETYIPGDAFSTLVNLEFTVSNELLETSGEIDVSEIFVSYFEQAGTPISQTLGLFQPTLISGIVSIDPLPLEEGGQLSGSFDIVFTDVGEDMQQGSEDDESRTLSQGEFRL